METARILWISRQKIFSLNRLVSCRLTPHRCSLNSPNITRPDKVLRTGLYPATTVTGGSHTSSLSSISLTARSMVYGGCRLRNPNHGQSPVVYPRYIQSSGVTIAQNYSGCSRSIHTSGRRNVLLPPHIWLLIKPVQKLLAIILGRSGTTC